MSLAGEEKEREKHVRRARDAALDEVVVDAELGVKVLDGGLVPLFESAEVPGSIISVERW